MAMIVYFSSILRLLLVTSLPLASIVSKRIKHFHIGVGTSASTVDGSHVISPQRYCHLNPGWRHSSRFSLTMSRCTCFTFEISARSIAISRGLVRRYVQSSAILYCTMCMCVCEFWTHASGCVCCYCHCWCCLYRMWALILLVSTQTSTNLTHTKPTAPAAALVRAHCCKLFM